MIQRDFSKLINVKMELIFANKSKILLKINNFKYNENFTVFYCTSKIKRIPEQMLNQRILRELNVFGGFR